ncbi:MAG: hypothetical protein KDB28_04770 [Tetrasphaera sp.]|nr:hypothetical protein [Actinomycetota bacterium]MCB1300575.1 hypothetical protein [Tetrasphaera sp.]
MAYDAQRQIIRTLARAAREFDRARDALMGEEQTETTVPDSASSAVPPEAAQPARGGVLGAATQVARAGAGAAKAAGRAAAGVHPRHPDWQTAILTDRIAWWVQRFGTAAAALTAVPGLLGKVGRLTGVGDVIGAAAQVLIVNAVAREMGIEDIPRRVAAAADIVLDRQLSMAEIELALAEEATPATGQNSAERADTGQDDTNQDDTKQDDIRPDDTDQPGIVRRLGGSAALVGRVARDLWRLNSDMDKRPGAGRVVGFARNLPAVGAVSSFAYERRGIARAAERARSRFGG